MLVTCSFLRAFLCNTSKLRSLSYVDYRSATLPVPAATKAVIESDLLHPAMHTQMRSASVRVRRPINIVFDFLTSCYSALVSDDKKFGVPCKC